ncbi:type I restriction enzyme HsdR N-terminal domain-containing protein [Vibrio rotiferianus]|uniref:type I restriction enzyme HsdR N-terminal domain-containing protein n=1 Tax=Vibrio rotiferianus TaxID=190895 RepID=UPI0011103F11|nr:type I restriction enzyme HsdR N-terminal domain-containing protein [Vibrio rotiferianus]TMX64588.1 hypothetical protein DA097_12745 [Vibrio rotiferianus]
MVNTLKTEEDVRTIFFYNWLKSKGVDDSQISFEKHITIQLGHNTLEVQKKEGRLDALIKSQADGRNLIVCELKGPDKPLNEATLDQAVSYARALKGNMAPIVVLSNSEEVKAYCSLTKNELTDVTGACLTSGQFPDSDDDFEQLKAEAISTIARRPEYLRQLLSKFSDAEIDILSGEIGESRKYCKATYTKLAPDINYDKTINIISGAPQSGKTNYICDEFMKYRSAGHLCLFFRSKSVKKGIKIALKERLVGESNVPSDRVNSLINNAINNHGLTFFIDGVNEISELERKELIEEIGFLTKSGCKAIITCTDYFINSIKTDSDGYQTEIFRKKNKDDIDIVKLPPLGNNYYDIIRIYKEAYETSEEPKHKLSSINSVGKYYQLRHSKPKISLENEYDIHKQSLAFKTEVLTSRLQRDSKSALLMLAEMLSECDGAVKECDFGLKYSNDQLELVPDLYITNGLLEKNEGYIDFYDESYRDILLIEKAIEINNDKSCVISFLSNFMNNGISISCITKYLCFYDVHYSYIEQLSNKTKSKILNAVILYVESNKDLSERPLNLILNIINKGIDSKHISPELAFEYLDRFNDIIEYANNITYDINIVHRILGYCCSYISISNYADIRYNESGIYNSQIENNEGDIYIEISKLALPYLLEEDVIFTYSFIEKIERFKIEFNGIFLNQIANLFSNIIEHVFNYDSHMCAYGSYVDVEVDTFKETGDPGELISAFHVVKTLRDLLPPSQTFDSTLEYLEQYLSELPDWIETFKEIDNLGLEYRYQYR